MVPSVRGINATATLGYVDGKNFVIEVRLAQGKYDRLPALASEFVASKVDVLVTGGVKANVGAKRATATTPIVTFNMGDAVIAGLVASYAANIPNRRYFIIRPVSALDLGRCALRKSPRIAAPSKLTRLDVHACANRHALANSTPDDMLTA